MNHLRSWVFVFGGLTRLPPLSHPPLPFPPLLSPPSPLPPLFSPSEPKKFLELQMLVGKF
jgi:hypothetical protein